MEKKIKALKAAYQAKDTVKVRNAARALVAYDLKHPFAVLTVGNEYACDITELAKRICEAPSIPL